MALGADLSNGLVVGFGNDRLLAHSSLAMPGPAPDYALSANLLRALGRYEFRPRLATSGFAEVSWGVIESMDGSSPALSGAAPVYKAPGARYALDYSGVYARLGGVVRLVQ